MPDYNPAVAAGFQAQQPNVLGTLEGISQLQIGQAHAGLYSLQALQQQRQFNALQQTSSYIRDNPGDARGALQTFLGGGGNPSDAPAILNSLATANAVSSTPGGMLPSEFASRLAAQKTAEEIPGARAKSHQEQTQADTGDMEFRGKLAGQLQVSPTQDTLRQILPQFVGHVSDDGMKELLSAATGPEDQNRIAGIATKMQSALVPVQEQAKTFNMPGPQQAQPGQAAQPSPQPTLKTPGQQKQVDYYDKLHSGIEALGNQSASALDDIHLAKAAINDPNFMSGIGSTYNLMAKKFIALGLGDPAKALPQEILSKVVAANINQQSIQMKAATEEMGASSSRLFQSQIEQMTKASQNPENTVAANRFLTEMSERAALKNIALADSANNYKGGVLDSKFENQFRRDASKPIFSNWELSHLDTIGAPMADKIKQIDPREIEHLKANPKNAPQFDSYYGPGTARAAVSQ